MSTKSFNLCEFPWFEVRLLYKSWFSWIKAKCSMFSEIFFILASSSSVNASFPTSSETESLSSSLANVLKFSSFSLYSFEFACSASSFLKLANFSVNLQNSLQITAADGWSSRTFEVFMDVEEELVLLDLKVVCRRAFCFFGLGRFAGYSSKALNRLTYSNGSGLSFRGVVQLSMVWYSFWRAS